MKFAITILGLLLYSLSSMAHHSRFEFSDERIELEGELVELIWRNPHPAFFVEQRGEDGNLERWRVEIFSSPGLLARAGVSADLFQSGLRVRIGGQPSTRRSNYMLGTHVLLPDGTEAVMGRRFDPIWSDKFVGGASAFTFDETVLADAASENLGLFRNWWLADGSGPTRRTRPFTDAALAIAAAVDPANTPATRCEAPGMPVPMMQPSPFELVDNGDTVTLHHFYFDTYRTIHLREAGDPSAQPATPLGYSVGRWDGDDLVVETSRINWPDHDIRGHPQSEQVNIVERFNLSTDQGQLHYFMEITDPIYMDEPAIFERTWVASNQEIPAWECEVF